MDTLILPSENLPDRPGYISVDSGICNGRPVVRGTRIPVQTVVEFLAAGDSIEDVIEEYPTLSREAVQACLARAARLMGNLFLINF